VSYDRCDKVYALCDFLLIIIILAAYPVSILLFYYTTYSNTLNLLMFGLMMFYIYMILYVLLTFVYNWSTLSQDVQQLEIINGTWSSYMSYRSHNGSKTLVFSMLMLSLTLACSIIGDMDIISDVVVRRGNTIFDSKLLLCFSIKFCSQVCLLLIGFFPSQPQDGDYVFLYRINEHKVTKLLSSVIHLLSAIVYIIVTLFVDGFSIQCMITCYNIDLWYFHVISLTFISFGLCCIQAAFFVNKTNSHYILLQLFSILLELLLLLNVLVGQAYISFHITTKLQ